MAETTKRTNAEEYRRKHRLHKALAAAIAGLVLIAALFSLCAQLLTTDTINGWAGLGMGLSLTVSGEPYIKMPGKPLRYFTRYVDSRALAEIDGVVMDRESPGSSGYLLLDGRVYSYGGGAFTSRFWIWTLKPEPRGPEIVVTRYLQEYLENPEIPKVPLDTDALSEWLAEGERWMLAAALKGHFGVQLTGKGVAGWTTVGDIVSDVSERLGKGAS